MSAADVLRRRADELGVGARASALLAYVESFHRWNQRINLSAARSVDEIADHVVDCLALVPHVPRDVRLVDIGSGGGLPGLVLAVARPDVAVTCVEPLHKKAAFLRQASRDLGLTVTVMTQRVNEIAIIYDVAVSRATFAPATWLEVGRGLVVPGGRVLAMEGLEQTELPAGATRHPYSLGDRTRAVLVLITPS